MTKLHILLLISLPFSLAQFSIQGPSDGNRRAQGLKYSQEKGIEYSDQRASQGVGDFSIQGASDGNSDFHIQGATDGNAQFNIQGATDGNAQFKIQGATDGNSDFRIQGATDGHSQSSIQGPYDANSGGGRALQYGDNSGFKVNWRSYQAQAPQHQPQQRPEPQYASETASPIRVDPGPPQPSHQPQAHVPVQQPQYKPYSNAPPQIKQLLQYQAQIPYLNIIPEQYRYDALAASQANAQQFQAEYQSRAPQEPSHPPAASQYRGKSRGPARQKRQAPQYQGAAQPHQQPPQYQGAAQPHQQPQYQRISQPPAEPQPHYSTNLPSQIQQILKFQAQIPYDNIANQIVYRPDKPYVPQPVPPPAHGSAPQYQGQPAYNQGQAAAYGQGQGPVRPVKENQY